MPRDPEKARAYREANRDRIRAISKRSDDKRRGKIRAWRKVYNAIHQQDRAEHYQSHQEAILAKQAIYRQDHLKEEYERSVVYRATHYETIKARKAANYQAHREQICAKRRDNRDKERAYVRAHAEQIRLRNARRYTEKRHQILAQNMLWRRANPARVLSFKHTRRARQAQALVNDLSAAQILEIKVHYDFQCVYCQEQFAPEDLTMDHITPFAKQGSNTVQNVVPSCGPCNSRKHIGPPRVPVQPLLLTIAPPKKKR